MTDAPAAPKTAAAEKSSSAAMILIDKGFRLLLEAFVGTKDERPPEDGRP